MKRTYHEVDSLEFSCYVMARTHLVFRAVSSQNELRKWWAPRVVMSRNKVSQQENQDVCMKLISSQNGRSVRYSWRPENWDKKIPQTTINFTIQDISASRQASGDGLVLEITHSGWVDIKERDKQKEIWELAIASLKTLLESKKAAPWWENFDRTPHLRQVNLPDLKQGFEVHRKRNNSKSRQLFQKLWKSSSVLYEYGKWYLDENTESFVFYYANREFYRVSNTNIQLDWNNFTKIPEPDRDDFKNRLSVEQDIDLDISDEKTILSIDSFQAELWIAWCTDLMREIDFSQ